MRGTESALAPPTPWPYGRKPTNVTTSSNSSERRIAINTAGRYVSIVISAITAFFLTPFLIHSVGKAAYGLQALSGQAVQFISLAATAVSLSYDRFAATAYARGDTGKMNAVLSIGLRLSLVSASALFLAALVTALFARSLFGLPPELVRDARLVLAILGASAACHIVNGVWKAPLFITQRFYLESVGSIIAYVGAAAGVVVLFHLVGPSIVLCVLLFAGLRVGMEWCCVIPLARRALPDMHVTLRAPWTRRDFIGILSFSGLNFLAQAGSLLYYATDSIIISNLHELGIAAVTDYNVAQRWDPQIRMVITSFVGVLTPLMTNDAATGNLLRLRNTILRGTRYSLLLALLPCVVLSVLAEPFFHFWLKSAFSPVSVDVMRVILVGLIVSIPGLVGYEALYATGRLALAVVATLGGGILNVLLCVVLVKVAHLGLLGVALGSVISIFLVNGVCIPLLVRRATGLALSHFFGGGCARAILGAVPLAAFALLLRRLWVPSSLVVVLVQAGLSALAYAVCVWGISLTGEDRSKVRRAVRSLLASARTFVGARPTPS